jgi:hypothetical protein
MAGKPLYCDGRFQFEDGLSKKFREEDQREVFRRICRRGRSGRDDR